MTEVECPVCTFQTDDPEEAKMHIEEHVVDLDMYIQSVRDENTEEANS